MAAAQADAMAALAAPGANGSDAEAGAWTALQISMALKVGSWGKLGGDFGEEAARKRGKGR